MSEKAYLAWVKDLMSMQNEIPWFHRYRILFKVFHRHSQGIVTFKKPTTTRLMLNTIAVKQISC
jgi:hypothetical protein